MMETCKEKLIAALREKQYHISTAESCTAGMVASLLADVSGASKVFEEGYITYSDRVKESVLGVSGEILRAYTAVSAEAAEQMALGVHEKTGAELTVSVTGYAGPGDAEDGTRAGTVYIGIYFRGQTSVKKHLFAGDRQKVRTQAAEEAVRAALERITESE